MLPSRVFLLAICTTLCFIKSTSSFQMPSVGKIHRRAFKNGKLAKVQKRGLHPINPVERQEIPNTQSFYRRRSEDDNQPSANNLASMQEFVSELMQMNKDWQKESMEKLKEGKSPDKFSWDQFNQQSKDFSDYGKNDNSDTSDEDGPHSSSKSSQSASSESDTNTPKPKQKPQQKPRPKGQPKPQPKEEPKPQPKEEQKSKPKPKPQPQPKPKPQPKEEPKAKKVLPQSKSKPQQNNNGGDYNKGNSGPGGVVAQHGFAGKRLKGEMTYFTPDLGACGNTNTESDFIVAVSAEFFNIFGGGMSNGNPVCGHKIRIYKNGKSAVATIEDECPPCTLPSIDMSPALFKYFEDPDVGRTSVEWEFI